MPCPVTFRFVARNLPTRARVMAWAPRENHLPPPFFLSFFLVQLLTTIILWSNPGGGSISTHVYIQIFFRPPPFRSPLPGRGVPPPPPPPPWRIILLEAASREFQFIVLLLIHVYLGPLIPRGKGIVTVDSKLRRRGEF